MNAYKLDSGQKHILMLIDSGKREDGWTPVSKYLIDIVRRLVPEELAIVRNSCECLEKLDDGSGRARLTEEGQNVVRAIKYLSIKAN
jgi:hypothetical protein